MTMDGFVITALHRELERELLPARVNRVYQPSPHQILLHLRRPGETLKLLLSIHPPPGPGPPHPDRREKPTLAAPLLPLPAQIFRGEPTGCHQTPPV